MVVSLYDWDPPGLQEDDYLGRYRLLYIYGFLLSLLFVNRRLVTCRFAFWSRMGYRIQNLNCSVRDTKFI